MHGYQHLSHDYLTHNDGSLDSQSQVLQSVADNSYHPLHAVNLLPQKDVHWSNGTHLLEPGFDFVGNVVAGKLLQHVSSLLVDNALSRLSPTTSAVFGLNGEDGVQASVGCVALVAVEEGKSR